MVTIALALVALASSLVLRRRRQTTAPRRVLLGLGQLLPGLVGFTTVGRLWWVPGALLLAAGVLTIGDRAATVGTCWWRRSATGPPC